MSIVINDILLQFDDNKAKAIDIAVSEIKKHTNSQIMSADIYKISTDARRKNNIKLNCSVIVSLLDAAEEKKIEGVIKGARYFEQITITPKFGKEKLMQSPVIAGFGPAGMFAGLMLAKYGYKPVIIERGSEISKRVSDVNNFMSGGGFDENSNIQFGEGGAGTFSDGKLTTRINDPLCREVLNEFVLCGAPKEILTTQKPHIGTDILTEVVKNIRKKIISLGGKVLFDTKLNEIKMRNNCVYAIVANETEIECSKLVLALGHSARETVTYLYKTGFDIVSKPFSVGVRTEHLQKEINAAQYGSFAGHPALGPAHYQLSHRDGDRGVYSFCMCPGGVVVPAASESGGLLTNGMSNFNRDGINCNAAIVVSVDSKDYGKNALDGIEFQRNLERKAFSVSNNYFAPAQKLKDFYDGKASKSFGSILPTYVPGTVFYDLNSILPKDICDMLKVGFKKFGNSIKGFDNDDVLLTGVETRTSSPVRINRNEKLQSTVYSSIYPCGEGAGYAGGIMSAAVDGIKTALAIMEEVCCK